MSTYRVVWRKLSNRHDREIFYCTAKDGDHAWQRCRGYVEREFRVRKPVLIEVRELLPEDNAQ